MEMVLGFMNESSSHSTRFTQQLLILSDAPESEDQKEDDEKGKYGTDFPGSLGNAKLLLELVY